MAEDPIRVLFVCLGNICRSPLAEGVFRSLAQARGLENRYLVDSAGTGAWHAGERPDQRSVEVARRNDVVLAGRARQIGAPDFEDFDYVIAMDRQNLLELRTLARSQQGEAHLHLLRDFDPEPGDGQVPDPYYGGPGGFERMYVMVNRACEALLDHLEERRLDRTTSEG
jgi:protein-tyrosine phosphatase